MLSHMYRTVGSLEQQNIAELGAKSGRNTLPGIVFIVNSHPLYKLEGIYTVHA